MGCGRDGSCTAHNVCDRRRRNSARVAWTLWRGLATGGSARSKRKDTVDTLLLPILRNSGNVRYTVMYTTLATVKAVTHIVHKVAISKVAIPTMLHHTTKPM